MSVIRSFREFTSARRRLVFGVAVVAAVLVATGIYLGVRPSDPEPLTMEFVLGGGAGSSGKGAGIEVKGTFVGLAVDAKDRVTLFVNDNQGVVRWQQGSSGSAAKTRVEGMDGEVAEQTAIGPDGSVYLATGDLWKVSPEGQAQKVISGGKCSAPDVSGGALADFGTCEITGVAVAEDGTIYVGDNTGVGVSGGMASFVHAVKSDKITLIAGRERRGDESINDSNPAVRNAIDPPEGTKATDVLVPFGLMTGRVAVDGDHVYWATGGGIVRINANGTLSPFVAARDPEKIADPERPFGTIGKAVDAQVEGTNNTSQEFDLVATSRGNDIYYAAGPNSSHPAGPFAWGGEHTTSQQQLIEEVKDGKAVYRVADGDLSPVAGGATAVAASSNALYLVAEANASGTVNVKENWRVAVVKVALPNS